ncbi:hypothetical protein IFR05_001974 [Cadophora sp. M221]|nr:hypothetical protein IFR05_001974 [Cadophora sp. M221]
MASEPPPFGAPDPPWMFIQELGLVKKEWRLRRLAEGNPITSDEVDAFNAYFADRKAQVEAWWLGQYYMVRWFAESETWKRYGNRRNLGGYRYPTPPRFLMKYQLEHGDMAEEPPATSTAINTASKSAGPASAVAPGRSQRVEAPDAKKVAKKKKKKQEDGRKAAAEAVVSQTEKGLGVSPGSGSTAGGETYKDAVTKPTPPQ